MREELVGVGETASPTTTTRSSWESGRPTMTQAPVCSCGLIAYADWGQSRRLQSDRTGIPYIIAVPTTKRRYIFIDVVNINALPLLLATFMNIVHALLGNARSGTANVYQPQATLGRLLHHRE